MQTNINEYFILFTKTIRLGCQVETNELLFLSTPIKRNLCRNVINDLNIF